MTRGEAQEYAKTMSYKEAVLNCIHAKGIAYRKASLIKLRELAEIADKLERDNDMTREEAIEILNNGRYFVPVESWHYEYNEALDMAISALQAEQKYVHVETYRDLYEKYIELKHKSAEQSECGSCKWYKQDHLICYPNDDSDLISRADAVKTVIRTCSPICDWQVGTQQYPDCVVAEINALPSADAVSLTGTMKYLTKPHNYCEVVRCKDCDNRHTDDCPMYHEEWYEIDEGDGYFDSDFIVHDYSKDDGFCSWAKMKGGDDE